MLFKKKILVLKLTWKRRLPLLEATTAFDLLRVFCQLLPDRRRQREIILFVRNTLHSSIRGSLRAILLLTRRFIN